LVRFRDSWPSLSFEILPEGDPPTGPPYSIQLISGTQGAKLRENYLGITRVLGITELSPEKESSDEEDSEEDEQTAAEGIVQQRVKHHGGINRLRRLPQDTRFVALFDDRSNVEIVDITNALQDVRADRNSTNLRTPSVLFTHRHSTEGFALDWSPLKQGRLASGDCGSNLMIWEASEGAHWVLQECGIGHRDSVEDIQWSPSEESVFASCSVDKTIKIWDSRQTTASQLSVEVSPTDVNVLSWNRLVDYMLASGDDDGTLKIWDLRKFQSKESIAEFSFHQKAITSVEWSPHESSMLVASSEDDQVSVWDLALERDPEEEAQFANSKNAELPSSIPPQLMFLHAGQDAIKEVHWHAQIPGMIASTASNGMNLFKPNNI